MTATHGISGLRWTFTGHIFVKISSNLAPPCLIMLCRYQISVLRTKGPRLQGQLANWMQLPTLILVLINSSIIRIYKTIIYLSRVSEPYNDGFIVLPRSAFLSLDAYIRVKDDIIRCWARTLNGAGHSDFPANRICLDIIPNVS